MAASNRMLFFGVSLYVNDLWVGPEIHKVFLVSKAMATSTSHQTKALSVKLVPFEPRLPDFSV